MAAAPPYLAGQYVSRFFFFLAVSTAGGDKCEGNLLDDVWFSTQPAPLQPDEAALADQTAGRHP